MLVKAVQMNTEEESLRIMAFIFEANGGGCYSFDGAKISVFL